MLDLYPQGGNAKTYKTWSRKGRCPGCRVSCGSNHKPNCKTRENLLRQIHFPQRELYNTNYSKNKELLDSFTKYCDEHPEERFWQALRSWSYAGAILKADLNSKREIIHFEDTFYIE